MDDAEKAAAEANRVRLGYRTLSDFLRSRAVSDAAAGPARNPALIRERTAALVDVMGLASRRNDAEALAAAKDLMRQWVKE
jgi:hypothetical protein